MEIEQGAKYAQAYLDEQIIRILHVPESITTLVTEFLELRLKLVGGGTRVGAHPCGRPEGGVYILRNVSLRPASRQRLVSAPFSNAGPRRTCSSFTCSCIKRPPTSAAN
jgi:hypothetical protein